MSGPVVERVAPELAGRAEVIGGHAGDKSRPAPLGQKEDFGVRPDIAGIGRHEERHVSDQAHTVGVRVRFQPLAIDVQVLVER
jgi:hypothetical protein